MKTSLNLSPDLIYVIIYTSIAFLLMASVLVLFFYFSRKKILKKELEKRDLQINYQKELLHSVILTQEEERERIAKDLHDEISSSLNIISLNAHLLSAQNLSPNEMTEITTNILAVTAKAIENSRRIAHDLLPPVLEKFGLDAGIQELCSEINSSKQLVVQYKNECDLEYLSKEYQLHVFRIIQELINNSIKHGKATVISILFEPKDGITCLYTDNGKGFDVDEVQFKKGLGMKNIDSRVSLIHGEVFFKSKLQKGTTVNFNFFKNGR